MFHSNSGTDLTLTDESFSLGTQGLGEFLHIEPQHPDRPSEAQVVTFKDRYTAEQFVYGTKDIPGVGRVEMSWVGGTVVPVTGASGGKRGGVEGVVDEREGGDTGMGGTGDAGNGNGNGHDGNGNEDEGRGNAGSNGGRAVGMGTAMGQMGAQETEFDVAEEDEWGMVE